MWTKNDIEFKTRMNQLCYKEMKEKVVDYENDNGIEHESRKQSHICKACAYLDGKMSLQAFTDADCQNCDTKMTFVSSYTDKLCFDCAKKLGLCKHCGGLMD